MFGTGGCSIVVEQGGGALGVLHMGACGWGVGEKVVDQVMRGVGWEGQGWGCYGGQRDVLGR